MRTIKFRGQNIKGEWNYGFLSYNKDVSSDYEWFISNKSGKPFAFGAIEKSIGQFTGLYDKNGKEIYEGDILKTFPIISSDKIAYDSFNVMVKFINSSWIANGILGKRQAEISEVIGNIYEHRELLTD